MGEKLLPSLVIFLLMIVNFIECVPTSVLVAANTKDGKRINNFKVKRSSESAAAPLTPDESVQHKAPDFSDTSHHSSDSGGKSKISFENSKNFGGWDLPYHQTKSGLQKRGIPNSQIYSEVFNDVVTAPRMGGAVAVPYGVWADELDPVAYPDLQDFEGYRSSSRPNGYDNLQNLLNAEMEMYSPEPAALQSPYSRYYSSADRKKRSNKPRKSDMRIKRETKLTSADLLALVALVEAGERSREDKEAESQHLRKSILSSHSSQQGADGEWSSNSWVDPAIDFYGLPYDLDSVPRYDAIKDDQRLTTSNYQPSKRYMVAKKKRSMGHFFKKPEINSPIGSHYLPEFHGKGLKKVQKFF